MIMENIIQNISQESEKNWKFANTSSKRAKLTVIEADLSNPESRKFFKFLKSISSNLEAFQITKGKNIKETL